LVFIFVAESELFEDLRVNASQTTRTEFVSVLHYALYFACFRNPDCLFRFVHLVVNLYKKQNNTFFVGHKSKFIVVVHASALFPAIIRYDI
jgi:hypothetical protein